MLPSTFYVSHNASVNQWFVVEPLNDPWPQVESLLNARRQVYFISLLDVEPDIKAMHDDSVGMQTLE